MPSEISIITNMIMMRNSKTVIIRLVGSMFIHSPVVALVIMMFCSNDMMTALLSAGVTVLPV
jgi:hypothetical protein